MGAAGRRGVHEIPVTEIQPDVLHLAGNGKEQQVARTEVVRGGETRHRPTAFLIRPDMPGFVVEDTELKMGIRGSSQARLRYDDLQVPDDHVLGQVGKGFSVAVNVLNSGRLSLASGCTAATRRLVGEMVRYAEQRVQFGSPLADFEITQRIYDIIPTLQSLTLVFEYCSQDLKQVGAARRRPLPPADRTGRHSGDDLQRGRTICRDGTTNTHGNQAVDRTAIWRGRPEAVVSA